jgi:iron complex transport system substrate-binding protein
VALPAGRGAAHRRHQRLHRAAAPRAQEKPRVSAFLDGKIDRIVALQPDLVIGFSDMQAALADKLIRAGLERAGSPTSAAWRRSSHDAAGGRAGGRQDRAEAWIAAMQARHAQIAARPPAWPRRPRVYFEEWDEPMISAIRWVSSWWPWPAATTCSPNSPQSLGRDRVIADALEPARRAPDLIVGSWCGKKFRPERVAARPGWAEVPAVREGRLHEIKSATSCSPARRR